MQQLLKLILLAIISINFGLTDTIDDQNSFTQVEVNGKLGIKNGKGEWLFKPQFDKIVEDGYCGSLVYGGGVFLVVHGGKKGIVNTKGKWVVREYDEILHGQENRIVDLNGWIKVKIGGKWGVVDTDGRWIFKPQFDEVASFTVKDWLTVRKNGKWGFIDTGGKWVIEPVYDDVYDFAENDATGFGRIIRDGKEGYVSELDGLLLEPTLDKNNYSPEYEDIVVLQKTGLLKVGSQYDKWGVIDRNGKWILKQTFDDIRIENDRIYVKSDGKNRCRTFSGVPVECGSADEREHD
jgi:hypothetical protein